MSLQKFNANIIISSVYLNERGAPQKGGREPQPAKTSIFCRQLVNIKRIMGEFKGNCAIFVEICFIYETDN